MFTAKNFLSVRPFHLIRAGLAALFLLLVSSANAAEESPSASPTPMTENPLLKESSLDFHYPPFDQIKDAHFAPAYEKGMAEQLKEIEPIAANPEPPTFENTIVALGKNRRTARTGRPHFFQSLEREHESHPAKNRDRDGAETVRAAGRDLFERPALQARRDALQQSRKTRSRRRIDLVDRALLQGFRARRRAALRRRQDQAQEDERRARRTADEVFAERPEGKERRIDRGRETRGTGWFLTDRVRRRNRRGEGRKEGGQVRHSPPEHDAAAGPDRSEKSPVARTDHENVARAQQPRWRVGQSGRRPAHGQAARRTRGASRLRQPRRLST